MSAFIDAEAQEEGDGETEQKKETVEQPTIDDVLFINDDTAVEDNSSHAHIDQALAAREGKELRRLVRQWKRARENEEQEEEKAEITNELEREGVVVVTKESDMSRLRQMDRAILANENKNKKKKRKVIDLPPSTSLSASTLSREQNFALYLVQHRLSIFITGGAGTGKSFLIRNIIRFCESRGWDIAVTASTGIAAVNINGRTLLSWVGQGLYISDTEEWIARTAKRILAQKDCLAKWQHTQVLLIEEISMVTKYQFTAVDKLAREVRRRPDAPFGGMQVIAVGDFFQLPPVSKDQKSGTIPFCFDSPSWTPAFQYSVDLKQTFRQSDPAFIKVLNEIRVGKLQPSSIALLQTRLLPYRDAQNMMELKQGLTKDMPIFLFPYRNQVDQLNRRAMSLLASEKQVVLEADISATVYGLPLDLHTPETGTDAESKTKERRRQAALDMAREIMQSAIFDCARVQLKVGAQVLLCQNLDPVHVNGSRGFVVDFERGTNLPYVLFDNDTEPMLIQRHEKKKTRGCVKVRVSQVPITCAYALTIHKSQGLSLQRVATTLAKSFEVGQSYVAASRCTSLEGLTLLGFSVSSIQASPQVAAYYEKRLHPITQI